MISSVILAAGLSRRLGKPKQMLMLGDKTMLEHVLDNIMKTDVGEIIVVLGAFMQEIRNNLSSYDVKCVYNSQYNRGQGTSVAVGAGAVSTDSRGIMYATVDQPFLSPDFLNRMIAEFERNEPLILKPEVGMPAIFNSSLRQELMTLSGEAGGRQLIEKYRGQVVIMSECPSEMTIDVDTEEDYRRVKKLWLEKESACYDRNKKATVKIQNMVEYNR